MEKKISFKHFNTVARPTLKGDIKQDPCGECQVSCQSACKTSATVGNQVCER